MPPLKHPRREKFCLEYIKTGNAAGSAVLAGYSVKTVRSMASYLLTNINVRSRIAELQQRAEDKKIASVIERKQILTEILRAKLPDFMELGADGSWVNIGPETPNGRAIQEIHSRTDYDENGEHPTIYTSVKLINPIDAIKELNKMEQVYDESPKINILNQTLIQNNLSSLSDEELDTLERIVAKTNTVINANQTGESPPAPS